MFPNTSSLDEFNLDEIIRQNAAQQTKKRGRRDATPSASNPFVCITQARMPTMSFDNSQADASNFDRLHSLQPNNQQPSNSVSVRNVPLTNRPQFTRPKQDDLIKQLDTDARGMTAPFSKLFGAAKHNSDPLPSSFWDRAKHAQHEALSQQTQHAVYPTEDEQVLATPRSPDSPNQSPRGKQSRRKLSSQRHLPQVSPSV